MSALVVVVTGCGGSTSSDLYDARATRDCLRGRPEYAGSLPADSPTAPTRTVMYVSRIARYPTARYDPTFALNVGRGTERLGLFFDGPANETLSQLQTPGLFFYSDERTARKAYRARVARLDKASASSEQRASIRRMSGIARNVVILWMRPDVPQRLRAIIRGCLRS